MWLNRFLLRSHSPQHRLARQMKAPSTPQLGSLLRYAHAAHASELCANEACFSLRSDSCRTSYSKANPCAAPLTALLQHVVHNWFTPLHLNAVCLVVLALDERRKHLTRSVRPTRALARPAPHTQSFHAVLAQCCLQRSRERMSSGMSCHPLWSLPHCSLIRLCWKSILLHRLRSHSRAQLRACHYLGQLLQNSRRLMSASECPKQAQSWAPVGLVLGRTSPLAHQSLARMQRSCHRQLTVLNLLCVDRRLKRQRSERLASTLWCLCVRLCGAFSFGHAVLAGDTLLVRPSASARTPGRPSGDRNKFCGNLRNESVCMLHTLSGSKASVCGRSSSRGPPPA
jgi:hypothetical protein